MKALALSAVAVALVSTLTLFAAPKTDKADVPFVKIYNVADLPVWRTNLKQTEFAPEILNQISSNLGGSQILEFWR